MHIFKMNTQALALPSLRISSYLVSTLALLSLAGCAAQMAYRDGVSLIEKGQIEQGLKRLNDAVEAAPGDAAYRSKYLQTKDVALRSMLDEAERRLRAKNVNGARDQYNQILKIEHDHPKAIEGIQTLDQEMRFQELMNNAKQAATQNNREAALNALRTILIEMPSHQEAKALLDSITVTSTLPVSEPTLAESFRKPISIEFKDANLTQVFEVISRTSGLNFVFDREVRLDQRTSIFLKNSTVESALHTTLLTNQLTQQVIDTNTVLIFPNTQTKLKEYQEMVVKTFFLTNANAKEIITILQTITKSKDMVVDEKRNGITLRDSPDVIRIAEKLIAVYDIPEPEVMLEVEVLEIKRTRLQELGIKWPDSLSLTPLTSGTGNPLTLRDLTNNVNSRTTGVSIPTVNINAKAQDSDVKILANPRIRARNHETATIQIGERVPNVTTTSTATFVSESTTYTDVGLKLEVEPRVFLDNDVGIRVKLEVSNVVSQSQTKNGATTYQLGTRNAATSLRLKDGETQILAGLINNEDRSTGNKVPGLGDFPVIGRLFGNTADNTEKTEIVLSITPRLIRNIKAPEAKLAEFTSGTDTNFRVRPEKNPLPAVSGQGTSSNNAEAAKPTTPQNSPLQIYAPAEVTPGEVFNAHIAMQAKDHFSQLVFSVKIDPQQFEIVEVKDGRAPNANLKQPTMRFVAEKDGQINVFMSGSNESPIKPAGINTTIALRALTKISDAKIAIISATGIKQSGEVATLMLPSASTISVK
ncbi:secretin N-terminal domain-containing protein [Undibacterium flavidum]|uniref:General secretion pathway protein GspD n=1 Tax=Undibacterium flavidum TaxID=2762297 RepID=A0ABR6YEB2_9BURK|nr:secretin N-terminal domain-containing protein [Undibacterium flavidum]MBC3874898.1 general secretion pathway protein GspD [Undibacterium flavidum]